MVRRADAESPRWRNNLEIGVIGLGALLSALSQTLVLPVLPLIAGELDASIEEAQWLLTSTLLAAAVAVPVVSRLADMYGRRRMLIVSLLALLCGSSLDALTDDLAVMLAGRALSGVSVAAVPLGISLLVAVLPGERADSAVATVAGMLGVGSALGLPLAGVIAEHFDYHVLFWTTAGASGATLALVLLVIRSTPGHAPGRVDVPGILLLTGGMVTLILSLSQGSVWGWRSPVTVSMFGAAIVLLSGLVAVELRSPGPIVDIRALCKPPIAVTNFATVMVGFALFASFVGTSTYVQAPPSTGYGFNSSVLVAGLLLLPVGVMMMIVAPIGARLIRVWGDARVLCAGGLIVAMGLCLRMYPYSSMWPIGVGTSVVGLGTGLCFSCLPSLINRHSPAADLAAANGINTLARTIGSTLSSAVGGTVLGAMTMTVGVDSYPSLAGYRVLFGICAAAAIVVALAGVVLATRRFSKDLDRPETASTRSDATSSTHDAAAR